MRVAEEPKLSNREAIHLDLCLRASYDFPLVGRNKIKMKKLSSGILFLFLAIGVQAATILVTLDPNSTEGDYYGGIYFKFSVEQDSRPFDGETNHIFWSTSNGGAVFTQNNVQIAFGLTLGLAEAPDELNILSTLNVTDPNMNIQGYLGSEGDNGYEEQGYLFDSGTPETLVYTMADHSNYHDFNLNTNTTCTLGFTMNINFDGSVGTGTGNWYINYTVPQIISAPEPAVTLQLALGGCCLWFARARQRRRN